MLTFKDICLQNNPFSISPGRLVWADRSKLKEELERHLTFSLMSRPSTISAIFWGKWGAGKTFSMKYFSQDLIIKELMEKAKQERPPFIISLTLPMNNILDTFYFKIFDDVWMGCLKNELPKLVKDITGIEQRSKELSKFLKSRNLIEVFSTGNPELITQYLNGTITSLTIRKHKISRTIQTSNDKLDVITDLLNLLCKIKYSKVIMWIDDAERVESLPARELSEMQTLLRDLIDYVPENLDIILNFTPKPGRELEDVLMFLGDAVRRRLGKIIKAEELNDEDFLIYVEDLLKEYRANEAPSKYYPFEKEALEYVFQLLKDRKLDLTPREINMKLSQILELAMFQEIKPIKKEYINKIKDTLFP